MSVLSNQIPLLPIRSLYPLTALVIIAGTVLWGPFVSLALAYGWWQLVARVG